MSYSILAPSPEPPLYQTPATYDTHRLAAIEEVCDVYLRSGYKITSHSPESFVLVRERRPVSILAVLLLVSAPPLLILYLVIARNRRDEVVCVRLTSRGVIEETGDTLAVASTHNRRILFFTSALAVISVAVMLLFLFYSSRDRTPAVRVEATQPTLDYYDPSSQPAASGTKSKRKAKQANADVFNPQMVDLPPVPPLPASSDYGAIPESSSIPSTDEPHTPKPLTTKNVTAKTGKPEPMRMVQEGEVLFSARGITGERVYSKAEVDTPAQIIAKPEPIFTAEGVRTSGTVRLEAVCRPNGEVTDIRVVEGLPDGLTWAAIKAARGIIFTPAYKDGKPVPMLVRLSYNFNVN
jgi:outer membrane biosynthesis protein TonB